MNYWDAHGLLFIISLFLFPRASLLISGLMFGSPIFGGLLWWCGWIFVPRLLVAVLATSGFWETNPVLVVLAWIWALGGDGAEKTVVIHNSKQQHG